MRQYRLRAPRAASAMSSEVARVRHPTSRLATRARGFWRAKRSGRAPVLCESSTGDVAFSAAH